VAETFEDLINQYVERALSAFMASIDILARNADLPAITERLNAGDIEGAVSATHLDQLTFDTLRETIESGFKDGGRFTANSLSEVRIPAQKAMVENTQRLNIRFDARNPRAESILREFSSTKITGDITDTTREGIREALRLGMEAGNNPKTVALDLVGRIGQFGRREGGLIGLTEGQVITAAKMRGELETFNPAYFRRTLRPKRYDALVRKYFDMQKKLPFKQREIIYKTYTNRLLRLRGETIARTEMLQSLHKGQYEAAMQAVESGQLDSNAIRRVWWTARDKRVRDSHRALDGDSAGLNERFANGLLYPGDPEGPPEEVINCRCYLQLRVDFLANLGPAPKPTRPRNPGDFVGIPEPIGHIPPAEPVGFGRPKPAPSQPKPETNLPFVPARTRFDVFERMRDFIGKDGIFKDTPEMTVADYNQIMAAMHETYSRFDMPKVTKVVDFRKGGYIGQIGESTIAAYDRFNETFITTPNMSVERYKEKSVTYDQRAKNEGINIARNVMNRIANSPLGVDAELARRFDLMEEYRWGITRSPSDTMYHELGHRLHLGTPAAGKKINAILPSLTEGWQFLISEYSGSDLKEFVAESFSLYMKGDKSQFWRIYPPLLEVFQELDKAYVGP